MGRAVAGLRRAVAKYEGRGARLGPVAGRLDWLVEPTIR
jgi:hypothetical protein